MVKRGFLKEETLLIELPSKILILHQGLNGCAVLNGLSDASHERKPNSNGLLCKTALPVKQPMRGLTHE